MRISDWSADVCSSDLLVEVFRRDAGIDRALYEHLLHPTAAYEVVHVSRTPGDRQGLVYRRQADLVRTRLLVVDDYLVRRRVRQAVRTHEAQAGLLARHAEQQNGRAHVLHPLTNNQYV